MLYSAESDLDLHYLLRPAVPILRVNMVKFIGIVRGFGKEEYLMIILG